MTARSASYRPAVLLLLSLLLSLRGAQQLHGQSVTEDQIKAAYLYNFAKFIQWPPEAFSSAQSPLLFCIPSEDAIGQPLDGVVQGKAVEGHPLTVRHTSIHDDLKMCQVVFVGGSDKKRVLEVVRRLKGLNALAVGDCRGFAEMGGGIQFYRENDNIRFSINVDALQRAHLTASSKLLSLARIVHDGDTDSGE